MIQISHAMLKFFTNEVIFPNNFFSVQFVSLLYIWLYIYQCVLTVYIWQYKTYMM